jgi:hypothetical protein
MQLRCSPQSRGMVGRGSGEGNIPLGSDVASSPPRTLTGQRKQREPPTQHQRDSHIMTQSSLSPSWSPVSSLPDLSETESVPGPELDPTSPRTPALGVRFDVVTSTRDDKDHDRLAQHSLLSQGRKRTPSIISISHMRSSGTVVFMVRSTPNLVTVERND